MIIPENFSNSELEIVSRFLVEIRCKGCPLSKACDRVKDQLCTELSDAIEAAIIEKEEAK